MGTFSASQFEELLRERGVKVTTARRAYIVGEHKVDRLLKWNITDKKMARSRAYLAIAACIPSFWTVFVPIMRKSFQEVAESLAAEQVLKELDFIYGSAEASERPSLSQETWRGLTLKEKDTFHRFAKALSTERDPLFGRQLFELLAEVKPAKFKSPPRETPDGVATFLLELPSGTGKSARSDMDVKRNREYLFHKGRQALGLDSHYTGIQEIDIGSTPGNIATKARKQTERLPEFLNPEQPHSLTELISIL